MRTIKLVVISLTMAILTIGQPTLAAQSPPEDASFTIILPAGAVCDFGVELAVTGKGKTIDLPGERFILTGPNLYATITNLDDPSKQVTLNVTAPFHQTTYPDGSMVFVSTGRSLLFDSQLGWVLVIGNFSYGFDPEGNQVQPLQGNGQIIDACNLIS